MTHYRVRKLPADLAGSGWYELLSPPPPPQVLEDTIDTDWVIIGAGFAGLAAARRLSQLRDTERIIVLDAQRLAWGASGRNSGFMIDLPHELNSDTYASSLVHDQQQIVRNRAAIAFAREAVEEFGLHEFFAPMGKIYGAANDSGLQALNTFTKHLDALKEDYTHLNADAMCRITGSEYYVGGIHTPGAAIIQPAGYIRGLAAGLTQQNCNVSIFENSPVLRIDSSQNDQQPHVVHTPKGRVNTANIILTVNGHAESFGLYEKRLIHLYTFASMTRQLSADEQKRLGGEQEWALIPANPMGSTLRRIRGGRIVVRNVFTYNPEMATSEKQISRIGRRHDKSFRARFPQLAEIDFQYRWGGQLCLSLNSVPGFGEIERGIYSAVCQNGLGTVQGTLSGKLIAEYATRSNNPMIDELLQLDPPQKICPEPFMALGVKTNLAWRQWRAGRDL